MKNSRLILFLLLLGFESAASEQLEYIGLSGVALASAPKKISPADLSVWVKPEDQRQLDTILGVDRAQAYVYLRAGHLQRVAHKLGCEARLDRLPPLPEVGIAEAPAQSYEAVPAWFFSPYVVYSEPETLRGYFSSFLHRLEPLLQQGLVMDRDLKTPAELNALPFPSPLREAAGNFVARGGTVRFGSPPFSGKVIYAPPAALSLKRHMGVGGRFDPWLKRVEVYPTSPVFLDSLSRPTGLYFALKRAWAHELAHGLVAEARVSPQKAWEIVGERFARLDTKALAFFEMRTRDDQLGVRDLLWKELFLGRGQKEPVAPTAQDLALFFRQLTGQKLSWQRLRAFERLFTRAQTETQSGREATALFLRKFESLWSQALQAVGARLSATAVLKLRLAAALAQVVEEARVWNLTHVRSGFRPEDYGLAWELWRPFADVRLEDLVERPELLEALDLP